MFGQPSKPSVRGGVDSLTHTNRPLPEGGFRKDLDKIAAFVEAARAT